MDTRHDLDLADIPGLGPVRRDALAEAGVVDLKDLLALKVTELAAVRGIGLWQARKIREYLRQKGLLVENGHTEAAAEDAPLVIHEPETPEQAEAVVEVIAVIEAHAEVEARVEAEVELLTEALEAAQEEDGGSVQETLEGASAEEATAEAAEVGMEEQELEIAAYATDAEVPDEEPDGEEAPEESELEPAELAELEATGAEPEVSAGELFQDLQERRERLPDVALALIETIRQAAVNKQLTRQVTRLLITAGEFSTGRGGSSKQLAAATEALAQTEELLQRALEKEAFSEKAQKELADRIRKRRKSLDRLLEEPEVEDR
jgi:hypothetical protein